MVVRFSSFKGIRNAEMVEGGYTTRAEFELPHRMMLTNLSLSELRDLKHQCEELITHHKQTATIYLGSIEAVEEVENHI